MENKSKSNNNNNNNKLRIKKKRNNTCEYFGIDNCNCCKLKDILNKNNNKTSMSNIENKINTHNTSCVIKTDVENKNLPSTSSESDIMTYVNSLTDIDIEEERKKVKEYEDKFIRMIKGTSSTVADLNLEEEEIDVVNGSLEDISTLFQSCTKTTENSEQTSDILENENREEIDTVNVKTVNDYLTTKSNKRTRNEEPENEIEEEIDVVNLPVGESNEIITLQNTTLKPKKKKSNITNMTSTAEDEIIDVVNLADETSNLASSRVLRSAVVNLSDETPNLASLSSAVVASNRILRSSRKNTTQTNQLDVIDLINTSREDSVIEITDSPVPPRVISGVINIDDDDQDVNRSPQKPGAFGNCPVCFEDLSKSEIMSTMCGHVFCAVCIKTVIKTNKKCPKCRKNLTLKMVHPLFF